MVHLQSCMCIYVDVCMLQLFRTLFTSIFTPKVYPFAIAFILSFCQNIYNYYIYNFKSLRVVYTYSLYSNLASLLVDQEIFEWVQYLHTIYKNYENREGDNNNCNVYICTIHYITEVLPCSAI